MYILWSWGTEPGFALFFTLLVTIWLIRISHKLKKLPFPLPPGPCGLPIVGYLPFLGTNVHQKFTHLAKLYGPIYKLWLGNKLCVVISSPSLVKEVTRDYDSVFANHDISCAARVATYGGNDIVVSSYGPKWPMMRKMFIREMLGNSGLDGCYELRRQEVQKAIKDLYGKIGKPVNLGQTFLMTVINAAIRMVCGDAIDVAEELIALVVELLSALGTPNISDIYPALRMFDLQGIEKKMKKGLDMFDQIFNRAIERKRLEANGRAKGELELEQKRDFLQLLLELKERKDSAASSITLVQLKVMLMDIVVGGTDTIATAIEWAMTELLLHPKTMKTICEELKQVVGLNCIVEESHLPKLQSLTAVIKETMRLHPPLPFLVPRSPSQTTTIAGYTVPKDTKILINVHAIHRDQKLWDSPLEFRPERFMNDETRLDFLGNRFQFMPFGSGMRICAGQHLAERMMMLCMASFLHFFDWESPSEREKLDTNERFGLVLKKMTPLVAIPRPRLSGIQLYM